MRRRPALGVLSLGLLAALAWPADVSADGTITVRLVGAVRAGASDASFTLINQTPDAISFTTYDGGALHNGIERLENGAWTDVGLGYCGLGMDGETSVPAGQRTRVRAYLPQEPGTYRILVHVSRHSASGPVPEVVVSAPFQRR